MHTYFYGCFLDMQVQGGSGVNDSVERAASELAARSTAQHGTSAGMLPPPILDRSESLLSPAAAQYLSRCVCVCKC